MVGKGLCVCACARVSVGSGPLSGFNLFHNIGNYYLVSNN